MGDQNPVNRILVPLQEVSDHAKGNSTGGLLKVLVKLFSVFGFAENTHVRVAVDASGYAGKCNRSQIVFFHHFQAVQIGVFEHLLKSTAKSEEYFLAPLGVLPWVQQWI